MPGIAKHGIGMRPVRQAGGPTLAGTTGKLFESIDKPDPGNPRDATAWKWVGKGVLAGRLLPIDTAILPSDFQFIPVRDDDGNVWFVVVARKVAGEWKWLIDWAAILRRFVFGNYETGRVTQDRRENVDIPDCAQSPGNGGNTSDAGARLHYDLARAIAAKSRGTFSPDDWETYGFTMYGEAGFRLSAMDRASPNAPVPVNVRGEDWRKTWIDPAQYVRFYGLSPKNKGITPRDRDKFVEPISNYWGSPWGYRAENIEGLLSVPETAKPDRCSQICDIPVSLPPIPSLGWNGKAYLIGDAWTRIAMVDTYNSQFYSRDSFGDGVANMAAKLDEARIVEIVAGVFRMVGGVVEGIISYNFSGVEQGLTSAVRGEAWQKIEGLESQLDSLVTGLKKYSLAYNTELMKLATAGIQTAPPSSENPAGGIDNGFLATVLRSFARLIG